MKKASNTTEIEACARAPQSEEQIGCGWRIKERKTSRSANRVDITSVIRNRFELDAEQAASPAGSNQIHQRRRWYHSLESLSGIAAAVVALIMAAAFLPPWLNLDGVSQKANAEIQSPSATMPGQETKTQYSTPSGLYQLHLGTYTTELDARLMWAGLEVDPDMLVTGLDPQFKSSQSEQGIFYDLLAGAFVHQDDAAIRCAWLRKHDVACTIIGG